MRSSPSLYARPAPENTHFAAPVAWGAETRYIRSAMISRPVLLYDDLCVRCTRFAALARALNWGGRVEFAPLDGPRAEALLPGMSRYDRLLALRFLTPAGGHFTAAAATSHLFATPGATAWAWRPLRAAVPATRRFVSWLYSHAEQTRDCEIV